MEMMLAYKTKGFDFLVAWQELINRENHSAEEIIENSMATLQNNYNIDSILYVEIVDKKPVIRYDGGNIKVSDTALKEITAYFSRHKKEFVASRYVNVLCVPIICYFLYIFISSPSCIGKFLITNPCFILSTISIFLNLLFIDIEIFCSVSNIDSFII